MTATPHAAAARLDELRTARERCLAGLDDVAEQLPAAEQDALQTQAAYEAAQAHVRTTAAALQQPDVATAYALREGGYHYTPQAPAPQALRDAYDDALLVLQLAGADVERALVVRTGLQRQRDELTQRLEYIEDQIGQAEAQQSDLAPAAVEESRLRRILHGLRGG